MNCGWRFSTSVTHDCIHGVIDLLGLLLPLQDTAATAVLLFTIVTTIGISYYCLTVE